MTRCLLLVLVQEPIPISGSGRGWAGWPASSSARHSSGLVELAAWPARARIKARFGHLEERHS